MNKIILFGVMFSLLIMTVYGETLQIGITPSAAPNGYDALVYANACGTGGYNIQYSAQSFMLPVDGNISSIEILNNGCWGSCDPYNNYGGGSDYNMIVSLRSSLDGADLANATVTPATYNITPNSSVSIPISYQLDANTTAYLTFHEDVGCDATTDGDFIAGRDESGTAYANGSYWQTTTTGGGGWAENTGYDWVMNVTYTPVITCTPSWTCTRCEQTECTSAADSNNCGVPYDNSLTCQVAGGGGGGGNTITGQVTSPPLQPSKNIFQRFWDWLVSLWNRIF